MRTYHLRIFGFILVSALFGFSTVFAVSRLSDQEKKEIIQSIYLEYQEDFPQVQDVSPVEAIKMLQSGEKVIFVDVREPAEMSVSILPDAISEETFLSSGEKYINYIVISYCTIGYRSGILASRLAEKGQKMYNLRGGILTWVHENGPVYSEGEVVRRIHVYGEKWNYAPEGFDVFTFSLWQRFF